MAERPASLIAENWCHRD